MWRPLRNHSAMATGDPSNAAMPRRGLIAGAAALAALVLTKATERPARAADGDALVLGNTAGAGPQTASNTTEIDKDAAVAGQALVVTNANGGGISGTGVHDAGVSGFAN